MQHLETLKQISWQICIYLPTKSKESDVYLSSRSASIKEPARHCLNLFNVVNSVCRHMIQKKTTTWNLGIPLSHWFQYSKKKMVGISWNLGIPLGAQDELPPFLAQETVCPRVGWSHRRGWNNFPASRRSSSGWSEKTDVLNTTSQLHFGRNIWMTVE